MKNKWKDSLLKTGLPLEFEVSRLIEKKKFFNCGQYEYLRENEKGETTEFSVDLRAFKFLGKGENYRGSIELLIECKYVHPDANWAFVPITNPEMITMGYINVIDDLCTRRIIDQELLYTFDNSLDFCLKGADLRQNSANMEKIRRGLIQLRYAIPKLYISNADTQNFVHSDEDLQICFLCPILVTNARLFVLNRDVDIRKIRKTKSFSSVAKEKEMLICHQTVGPELRSYIRSNVSKFFKENPKVEERFTQIHELSKRKIKHLRDLPAPTESSFEWDVEFAAESILIVNKDSLDKALNNLMGCISKTTLVRVAKLVFDPKGKSSFLKESK